MGKLVQPGVWEVAAQVARRRAGQAAFLGGGDTVTCGQLQERTAAVSALLPMAKMDRPLRVGILLPNSPDWAAGFLATAAAGGMCMALNPRMSPRELAWHDRELGLDVVFTNPALAETLVAGVEELGARVIRVTDIPTAAPAAGKLVAGDGGPDAPAICLDTSGTTGVPRLVVRTQGGLLANIRGVAAALEVDENDCFAAVVPFCHAFGFSTGLLLPLLTGGTVVAFEQFAPLELATTCREAGVTVLTASPFIYSMLLNSEATAADFVSVRICLSSGAKLPPEVAVGCREQLGLDIRQVYGSSEMGTVAVGGGGAAADPSAVGSPLPGVEVRIDTALPGADPAQGTGEVLVRTPAMMAGYLTGGTLDRTALVDGFFRTGDLGRLGADGQLYLAGRLKRMINVCGIKVDPVEIEQVLASMPGVRHAQVGARTDGGGMETIAAVLTTQPGWQLGRTDVVRFCRGRLAEYKIPRSITFRTEDTPDPLGKRCR